MELRQQVSPNVFVFPGYRDETHNITGIHPSRLKVFESVSEITDYLQVQASHPDFTSLGFFRNLHVIHGRVPDK